MRQISKPDRTRALLSQIGASHIRHVRGRLGSLGLLFSKPTRAEINKRNQCIRKEFTRHIAPIPLANMLALRFIFHDIAEIIPFESHESANFGHVAPKDTSLPFANLKSGAVDLNSVYGKTAVSGDLHEVLDQCLKSTWDRSKLWSNTGAPYDGINGDLLRLQRVVTGDGATLTETYFEQLADHLKPQFFSEDGLRISRAMIPEQRNDQTLLQSQFHFAVTRYHNMVAECFDSRFGKSHDRSKLYRLAAQTTLGLVHRSLIEDVLPAICDKDVLDWVQGKERGSHARFSLPLEGVLLISIILDHYPWPGSSANPPTIEDEALYRQIDSQSDNLRDGLPLTLFNSQRLPTRISDTSVVDWDSLLNGSNHLNSARYGNDRPDYIANLPDSVFSLALCSGEAAMTEAELLDPDKPRSSSETPLIPYIFDETDQLETKGKLGPLASYILAETLLSAVHSTSRAIRLQADLCRSNNTALHGLLTLQGLPE